MKIINDNFLHNYSMVQQSFITLFSVVVETCNTNDSRFSQLLSDWESSLLVVFESFLAGLVLVRDSAYEMRKEIWKFKNEIHRHVAIA
jgi:hypothetical protein